MFDDGFDINEWLELPSLWFIQGKLDVIGRLLYLEGLSKECQEAIKSEIAIGLSK